MSDFFDTDEIVKRYDRTIVRRILSYVKPYKALLAVSALTLLVATAGELVLPVLLQKVVDNTLLVSWAGISTQAEDSPMLADFDIPDTAPRAGGFVFVRSSQLAALRPELKSELKRSAFLDEGPYYITPMPDTLPNTVQAALNTEGGPRCDDGWFIAPNTYMSSLSAKDSASVRSADSAVLVRFGWILFAVSIAVLLSTFWQTWTTSLIGQNVMKDLRMDLFRHTTHQSLAFLSKQPVGRLVTRLTSDVESINEFFTSVLVAFIKDSSVMLGALIVLFIMNPRLGTITLLTLPPIIVITGIARRKARDAFRQQRFWVSKVNSFIAEHIAGIAIVKLFCREKASAKDFAAKDEELMRANLGEMYVFAVFRPLIEFFSSVSIAAVLWFGAGLHAKGLITLGSLMAFINLIRMFYSPLQDISEKYTILQSAMAGGERVFTLLDTEERIPDVPHTRLLAPRGRIEFDHVWFAYKDEEWVLKDVSFTVEPGQTAAIVGYTGAGKTTIGSLLTRMWDPQKGEIRLDGIPIRDLPLKDLRAFVRPVMQDVFLFSGTVADNIDLGLHLDRARIEQAAAVVRAHSFIQSLDGGYDARLGEGAATLSSGQRQLLSFARVVAHDPAIIVLDEATSSVDTETEKLLQEGLSAMMQGRTTVAIAHRLSTIQHADIILVLSEGRLVESGSHDSLIRLNGIYYNLYRLQYRGGAA